MRLDRATPTLVPYTARGMEYGGIPGTIKWMRQLARQGQADPRVRKYAIQVIREVRPKDHLSEVAALYYDTARRIRYTRDPAEAEYVQHPVVTLRERSGDCDDMATLLVGLLGTQVLSIGSPTQFITVGFSRDAGANPYTHVFMRAKDSKTGQWLVMDPVAGPKTSQMISKAQRWESHWS